MPQDDLITAGQAIGQVLKEEGVEYIFGVGGASIFPIMLGACQQGIKMVHTRHEQAAAFAADAYARSSRKPGVCFLFGGPGYTNASNGIAQAFYARSPVVALVGQHATLSDLRGTSAVSYAADACRSITRWSARMVDDRLAAFLTKKAFAEATAYPPGPALLELPENLLVRKRAAQEQRGYLPEPLARPPVGGGADPASVERAVRLLLAAERPVLVGGDGVYWDEAGPELRELAETLQTPVITRRIARGAVPEDHPLAFGGRARGGILRNADVALLVGLSLGYLEDYGRWGSGLRFIQVQKTERELETTVRSEVALVGSPRAVLRQMTECAHDLLQGPPDRGAWLEVVDSLKNAEQQRLLADAAVVSERKPIHPAYLAEQILEVLDDDATIVFDAYTGSSFLTERIRARVPGQVLDAGEWITVGHGVGMGIGAQLARPGKQVFVMMGDGGMGIGGFDVETAVRCNLPVVYLINNNSSWLSAEVDLFYGNEFVLPDGSQGNPFLLTPNVRYDRMFRELGCHTEHVVEPAEIRPALERSFASRKTSVINVEVERQVYHPMLLRSGPAHRWLGPEHMPEAGRRLAFPELYQERPPAG